MHPFDFECVAYGMTLCIRYLTSIKLSYINLSCPIPKSLGKLHTLRLLTIGANKLSGKIPESLGKCRRMFWLVLSGNNLRGAVPGKLSGMEHLPMALLSRNQFTGNKHVHTSREWSFDPYFQSVWNVLSFLKQARLQVSFWRIKDGSVME